MTYLVLLIGLGAVFLILCGVALVSFLIAEACARRWLTGWALGYEDGWAARDRELNAAERPVRGR